MESHSFTKLCIPARTTPAETDIKCQDRLMGERFTERQPTRAIYSETHHAKVQVWRGDEHATAAMGDSVSGGSVFRRGRTT